MTKKFFEIIKNKKIIILFFIIILSVTTIKLVTSSHQSNKTYVISGDEDGSVNNTENIITLKEESLLGEWEFDTNIQNKVYSKPSKIKLNFKNNSDVITDVYLLDHGDFITCLNEEKYKIEKNKNGETYIKIFYNLDPAIKAEIDPKYDDYSFKFIIKKIEENKIHVKLKYTSKESKKETLEGSLIKRNKSKL